MNNRVDTRGVNPGSNVQTHLASEENSSIFEGRLVSQAPGDGRYLSHDGVALDPENPVTLCTRSVLNPETLLNKLVSSSLLDFSTIFPNLDFNVFTVEEGVYSYIDEALNIVYLWYPNGKTTLNATKPKITAEVLCEFVTYTYENDGELTFLGEPLPAGFYSADPPIIYKYSLENNKHFQILFDSEDIAIRNVEYDFLNHKLFFETPFQKFASLKIDNNPFQAIRTEFVLYQGETEYGDHFFPESIASVKSLRLPDTHMLYLWYTEGKPKLDIERPGKAKADKKPAVRAIYWPSSKERARHGEYYSSLNYTNKKLATGNIISPKAYDYTEYFIFEGIKFPSGFYYSPLHSSKLYRFDSETNTHYKIIFDNSLATKYRSVEINPETDEVMRMGDSY